MMRNSRLKVMIAAVCSSVLAVVPVAARSGMVTADLLNVRAGASTSSEVIDMLSWGDTVTITYGPEDGWCEICHGGDVAYVNAAYIDGAGFSGTSASGSAYSGDYDEEDYDEDGGYGSTSRDYDEDDGYGSSSSRDYDEDEDEGQSGSGGYTYNATYLGNFTLTAYCDCAICCGTAGNPTASGVYATAGHTVAMGGVDFGTKLLINGHVYTVEDRGTPYGHVDIFFDSHEEASDFGLQTADVYMLN